MALFFQPDEGPEDFSAAIDHRIEQLFTHQACSKTAWNVSRALG
jgi:hypothetical protein